jgi:hypothetical protein
MVRAVFAAPVFRGAHKAEGPVLRVAPFGWTFLSKRLLRACALRFFFDGCRLAQSPLSARKKIDRSSARRGTTVRALRTRIDRAPQPHQCAFALSAASASRLLRKRLIVALHHSGCGSKGGVRAAGRSSSAVP